MILVTPALFQIKNDAVKRTINFRKAGLAELADALDSAAHRRAIKAGIAKAAKA
jgi:hypothetical protein